jgi:hypothetical protein
MGIIVVVALLLFAVSDGRPFTRHRPALPEVLQVMLDRGPPHIAILTQRLRAGLYEVIQGGERLSLVPKAAVNDAVAGVGGAVLHRRRSGCILRY